MRNFLHIFIFSKQLGTPNLYDSGWNWWGKDSWVDYFASFIMQFSPPPNMWNISVILCSPSLSQKVPMKISSPLTEQTVNFKLNSCVQAQWTYISAAWGMTCNWNYQCLGVWPPNSELTFVLSKWYETDPISDNAKRFCSLNPVLSILGWQYW